MNIDDNIIKIVYETVEENQKKFPSHKLERYDNWKDDIIEKVQDYIIEICPEYKYANEINKIKEELKLLENEK